MQNSEERILIAGMGISGQSVARYLESSGLAFVGCDDKSEIYDSCKNRLDSYCGYVLKSPGIPGHVLGGDGDEHHILNDIELFMRLCTKPFILVTGTNGKSTVVALVEHILNKCGIRATACGNNGVPVFDAYGGSPDVYIIELSSYQLENIQTLESQASVVLNIGVDHVDRYSDIREYQHTKEKIYQNTSLAVFPVNKDNERVYSADIIGYQSDVSGTNIVFHISDSGISLNGHDFCSLENIPLSGKHNYLNICAALCLCHGVHLDDMDILDALSTFKGLEHRLEIITSDAKGRLWVNDSKSTNVHAARAAVAAFDKDITLIMGGRGKSEDYSILFQEFHDSIKYLIIYGEAADEIAVQASSIQNKKIVENVSEAVSLANIVSNDSSTILFSPACASFDQYADFRSRGEDFRRCVIRELQ